jgi:protoheme IX farnesyltransferase
MLPVMEPDGASTGRQMMLCGAILLPVSAGPALVNMTGGLYGLAAVLLGSWLLYRTTRAAIERTRTSARSVLLTSVVYLPVLYACMALDRTW